VGLIGGSGGLLWGLKPARCASANKAEVKSANRRIDAFIANLQGEERFLNSTPGLDEVKPIAENRSIFRWQGKLEGTH
jgi:hypothetical protein